MNAAAAPGRRLSASAVATSSSSASGGGRASSYAGAAARGNVRALSEAVAEAKNSRWLWNGGMDYCGVLC